MKDTPRIAVQIPIKNRSSERVPNKNFYELCGKPLCYWLLDSLMMELPASADVYIDSESENVFSRLRPEHQNRFHFHRRPDWYASNEANGNHLLQQFVSSHPDYDIYAQAYVTAVMLSGSTVWSSIQRLVNDNAYDSLLLVHEECGWIWYHGKAINYDPERPNGLPRSQDAIYLKETTGLYVVRRETALKTGCRVGSKPLFHCVSKVESLDVDTLEDILSAKQLLESRGANP